MNIGLLKMYQAGIKEITLYENIDITYVFYDANGGGPINGGRTKGNLKFKIIVKYHIEDL